MSQLEHKNFANPDKEMAPPNSNMQVLTVGGKTAIKMTFQPGWKWSVDIHPDAGPKQCDRHHFGYQMSGVLHTVSTNGDGVEIDSVAGDIVDLPPGHDAWVVGDEPVVFIDFGSALS